MKKCGSMHLCLEIMFHAYNEGVALSIVERVKEEYIGMFQKLEKTIESSWLKL